MIKKVTFYILLLCSFDLVSQVCLPCDNIDFENQDLSCWSGYTGEADYINGRCEERFLGICIRFEKIPRVDNSTPGIVNDRQTLMTSGNDPVLGAIMPTQNPFTGTASVRIGNSNTGSEAESIERIFLVEPGKEIFTYYYAVVLEDPNHSRDEQPFFKIDMRDATGDVIGCGTYAVKGGENLPGITTTNISLPPVPPSNIPRNADITYKPWTKVSIDLAAYVGQNVTIKFLTGDCTQGGHFGYAYIDASCIQPELEVEETCEGTQLTTEPGALGYEWRNLTTNTLLPENSNRLTVETSGTYEVTILNENGCNIKFDTTINVSFFPVETVIVKTDNLCSSDSLGVIDISVTGGAGAPYMFSIDSGLTFFSDSIFNNLPPGFYDVIAKDVNDCGDTTEVEITAQTAITANVSVTNINCYAATDGEIQIANVIGGTPGYTYSIDNGVNFVNNTLFQNLIADSFYVQIKDLNNCLFKDTVEITSPDEIILTVSNDTLICQNGTATLLASAIGGVMPYSFNWGAGITGDNIDFNPINDTTVFVVGVDDNGCISDVSPVVINVREPLTVNAFNDTAFCEGGTANIRAVNPSGGDSNYVYTWDNGIGAAQNAFVTPNATTVYEVTLTDGCESTPVTENVTVTVYEYPKVDFVTDKEDGCLELEVVFTNITDPMLTGNCSWDFGDGITFNGCGPVNHTYTTENCFDVKLTVESTNGCISDTTMIRKICTYPLPVADFTYNPSPGSVLENEIEFINSSILGNDYNWTFAPLGTSTDINPIQIYPNDKGGEYDVCLEAVTLNNCKDTICKVITIDEKLLIYIPNSFTPDGDGVNDVFIPSNQGADPNNYIFTVTDRWGKVMFVTNFKTDGWDGSDQFGQPAKQDVYVWTIETLMIGGLSQKTVLRGHVNLIK